MTTGTTGILGIVGDCVVVRLLKDLAAANGVPPDGAPADVLKANPSSTTFFDLDVLRQYWLDNFATRWTWPDDSFVEIYETAGSGVITIASVRAWHYSKTAKKAFPPGPGADASKGTLNGGAALGETAADQLRHKEVLAYPMHTDGFQIELGTYGGTNPTFNVDWHVPIPTAKK